MSGHATIGLGLDFMCCLWCEHRLDMASGDVRFTALFCWHYGNRLVGLVVEVSASRAKDSRVRIPLAPIFFWGRVIPVT